MIDISRALAAMRRAHLDRERRINELDVGFKRRLAEFEEEQRAARRGQKEHK